VAHPASIDRDVGATLLSRLKLLGNDSN